MSAVLVTLILVPSLDETITKSKQWPAWTGSSDDFRRLLRLAEKQFQSLIPEHVEEETSYLRGRLAHPKKQLQRLTAWGLENVENAAAIAQVASERVRLEAEIEDIESRIKDEEDSASAAGRIELSLISKDNERRKVTGTADQLAEYIDGRDIQAMELSGPSGAITGHSIILEASRKTGLNLRISSSDSKWCLAGFSEIESEAARHVPRWHFMRSRYFLMSLFTGAAFSLIWFALDSLAKLTTATGKYDTTGQFWAYITLSFWSLLLGVWGTEWARRQVPAFEIVPNGGRSRGKAMVAIVGSTLGALVLGVLGNGISNAIFVMPK